MHLRTVLVASTAALLLGVLASGCDDAESEPTAGTGTSAVADEGEEEVSSSPTDDEAAPSPPGELPTCDAIKDALGAPATNLIVLPETPNGPFDDGTDSGVSCGWHTKQTAGSLDLPQYGGIGVSVTRQGDPYVEADMRESGLVIDDPRAEAIGAYVVALDGAEYDGGEQLNALGIQVVIGDTTVVLTSAGIYLNDVPELAAMTNEWAIGAGVRIWELML